VELTKKKLALEGRERPAEIPLGRFQRSIQSVGIAGGTPGTKCKRLPEACRLARRNSRAN
jgi:hypothetical protein